MASILTPTTSWQSSTLTANEVWQAQEGSVVIDTESTEADRHGITMQKDDTIQLASGLTVYYKKSHKNAAKIARIEVS